jgi:hypothetical protein
MYSEEGIVIGFSEVPARPSPAVTDVAVVRYGSGVKPFYIDGHRPCLDEIVELDFERNLCKIAGERLKVFWQRYGF